MNTFDVEVLKKLPKAPGVYLMKDAKGKILYIGKANDLKNRVKSYFNRGGDGRYLIPVLVPKIATIETIIVRSEKEALLLENNLIKQHKPTYNILLKDDKTYTALKLTGDSWPKVELIRYRGSPKGKGKYFGPYTSAYSARQTLELIHRLFPLRQCSDQEFKRRTRPCILYDMKRCLAPCVGRCSGEEYAETVEKATHFLQGEIQGVVAKLYQEIEQYSKKMEFEQAKELLTLVRSLEQMHEKQQVDQPFGVDGDMIGLYREGDQVCVALLKYRAGRLLEKRTFSFHHVIADEKEWLPVFLLQFYEQEPSPPKAIYLPFSTEKELEGALEEVCRNKIQVFYPQRGDKKAMVEMANLNAKGTFLQAKDESVLREKTLLEMQEMFHLNEYPYLIECFDQSNLSGSHPVSTKVCFEGGVKKTALYRTYHIKNANRSDDYGALAEVLERRLKRGKLPNLMVIDGGKGHLNTAVQVCKKLNIISVDLIGIAKEFGRHDFGSTQEKVYLIDRKDPIVLPKNSSTLYFLQQIRDEAHRTAIAFQKKQRKKAYFTSILDQIEGIGPIKKRALLRHFGSVKKIEQADLEALLQVKEIGKKDAYTIYQAFRN